jgi:hypothetical protein
MIAAAMAVAVALALSKVVVGAADLWVGIGAAAVFAFLGTSGDNLGDAVMFTIIIVAITALAFAFLPIPPFWRQVWLSVGAGVCTGKLVWGIYTDFFKPPVFGDNSRTDDRMRSTKSIRPAADKESNVFPSRYTSDEQRPKAQQGSRPGDTALREYDTVRVVRLGNLERQFQGTEGVCRSPKVGDLAVIVHEYDPDNPAAPVAVEMLDDEGYTVWLADFEKDELELVERP